MKCIRNVKTGKITRVSDEHASVQVKGGDWAYTSKERWKLDGRSLSKGGKNG